MKFKLIFSVIVTVSVSLSLLSCKRRLPGFHAKSKELIVLTRMSGTSYFKDREGNPKGFEYELVKAFADANGLEVKFKVESTMEEVMSSLRFGEAQIYAAGISKTPSRKKEYWFSPTYGRVHQQVVCKKRHKIENVNDLESLKIEITSDSSYLETLKNLKAEVLGLDWVTVEDKNTEELIEELWDKKEGCTIADSNIVRIHRRYFPELKVVYTFPKEDELGWVVHESQRALQNKVETWFQSSSGKKAVKNIYAHYYGHMQDFDVYDTQVFIERIGSRLPQYEDWLKEAGKAYGFDWQFLAAVAYQESQWNPKSVSPTGVRGFMMLTRNTAKSVGVTNRRDAKQSIFGGAKYLRKLMKKKPSYIPDKEWRWLALASYNVGYYHLRDARSLALLKEFNPNTWGGVRKALPLLSDSRYFKKLWYGYARGKEPVIYVERIRNFYDILKNVYGDSTRFRQPAKSETSE